MSRLLSLLLLALSAAHGLVMAPAARLPARAVRSRNVKAVVDHVDLPTLMTIADEVCTGAH